MTDFKEERARWKADNFAKHYGQRLNMQQVPKPEGYEHVKSPFRLIEMDYSEIELRVLALFSGDHPTHD